MPVTYEFTGPNPWDKATWDPRAQIEFMRATRADSAYRGDKHAQDRINQRIAQSDTKGIPPKVEKKVPFQVIIEKRFYPATSDIGEAVTLGFGETGPMHAGNQYPLAISSQVVTFPSATTPSQSACVVPATGHATVTLEDAHGNIICIVEFAPLMFTGTFDWTSPATTYPAGTILYVVADGDPTLSGVTLAFVGTAGNAP